ncbi:MAG: hypothetical protein OXN15_00825, partial [Chloroflexota bacterium]|nr:hypothetical protein [Chloroflexota bacterium]
MQERVYGVDFSGAKQAGNKIWIAQAVPYRRGIVVEACAPATEFLGCSAAREESLAALRAFIGGAESAAFGCDFPFSLPRELIAAESWAEFVAEFPARFGTADQFRERCLAAAIKLTGRKELKRTTDIEARAPFGPYNLRIYKQTYYGINDVLRPLVADNLVNVPPLHYSEDDAPWVMEVCPASTLKASGLYGSYKDARGSIEARENILLGLKDSGRVTFSDGDVRQRVIADAQGDA